MLDWVTSNRYNIKDRRIDDEAYKHDSATDSGILSVELCRKDLGRHYRGGETDRKGREGGLNLWFDRAVRRDGCVRSLQFGRARGQVHAQGELSGPDAQF